MGCLQRKWPEEKLPVGIETLRNFNVRAKVVGPGGEILARTWSKGGLAVAEVDAEAMVDAARAVLHHLDERRPGAYS